MPLIEHYLVIEHWSSGNQYWCMVAHVEINVQIAPTIECSAFRNYVWFFWGIQMECYFCVQLWAW